MTWISSDSRVITTQSYALVLAFVLLFGSLVLSGCQPSESYCYTGINAKNTPRHFVVVERADEASYYVADESDWRLTSIYDSEDHLFDEAGNYIAPWPSCKNIDSFDDVQHFSLQDVEQINGKRIIMADPAPCETLLFSGETNIDTINLDKIDGSPQRKWITPRIGRLTLFVSEIYHFISRLRAELINIENIEDTSGVVYISHIAEEGAFSPENNSVDPVQPPRGGRSAFEGKGEKGDQPPFVLVRLWYFNEEAKTEAEALFGTEETEDSGYLCGDVYYGYFSEE